MPEPNELTLDAVKAFLDSNEDAKKYIQSIKDNAVTKGITTYSENFMKEKFPKLLEDEVTKRLPAPQTEAEKRLVELERKFQQSEADKQRAILQNKLMSKATEKQLPDFLVPYAVDEDEEKSYQKLEQLGTKYTEYVNKEVEARLAGTGRKAPIDNSNPLPVGLENVPNNDPEWFTKNADALNKLMQK